MALARWTICIAYWCLLTVLLLARDPAALVGLDRIPAFPWGDLGIHFTAFAVLGLLVHVSRWPKGPGWAVLLLLAYAVATESLQVLVPPRSVQLTDYAENVLGIAAGSALYWTVWRVLRRRSRNEDPRREALKYFISAAGADSSAAPMHRQ